MYLFTLNNVGFSQTQMGSFVPGTGDESSMVCLLLIKNDLVPILRDVGHSTAGPRATPSAPYYELRKFLKPFQGLIIAMFFLIIV